MRQAEVYQNNVFAGILSQLNDGAFQFAYNDLYFADAHQKAVSLTLPKTQQVYTSDKLFPFFFNMLAEGANKALQTRQFQLDENDFFGLLLATTQSNTIGSVTLKEIK